MLKRWALGMCVGSVLVGSLAVAEVAIGQERLAQAQAPKQTHGGTPEEQKACSRDVIRHCKHVMDGDDMMMLGCLQQNRPKLAPACQKVLENHGV
jgi:hypothetical protein